MDAEAQFVGGLAQGRDRRALDAADIGEQPEGRAVDDAAARHRGIEIVGRQRRAGRKWGDSSGGAVRGWVRPLAWSCGSPPSAAQLAIRKRPSVTMVCTRRASSDRTSGAVISSSTIDVPGSAARIIST